MRIGLFAVWLWLAASPVLARDQTPEESPPDQEMEQIMMLFYNHMDSIDKNIEAKLAVEKLIQEQPNNPWLYDLWAAIEWNLIGLELGIPLEKRENILDKPLYRQRTEKYYRMTEQGLQLAEQMLIGPHQSLPEQRQWIFAKAALHFTAGKFAVRFEEGLGGLRKGDKAGAPGIRELRKILAQDPHFGPAFLLLGITRYQLSRQGFIFRTLIKYSSKSASYRELGEMCNVVFDKKESIAWIEKAQQYGAPEPWMKRNWLEATLALEGIYDRQRKDFNTQEEIVFIKQKYLPLLELLTNTLPENKKFAQKLEELKDYVQRKQTR